MARATLQKVRSAKTKRLRNAVIRGGIGTAIGLAMEFTLGTQLRNEGQAESTQSLLVIASAGIFAGIGAAIPGHTTIYEAPRQ